MSASIRASFLAGCCSRRPFWLPPIVRSSSVLPRNRFTPPPPSSPSRSFASSVPLSSTAPSRKPYYITTPIFYVNADPHIGHLYSDVIADVFARYHGYMHSGFSPYDHSGALLPPLDDEDCRVKPMLCTGTDEHGLKIQKVAEAAQEDPRQLCDRISQRFRQLADSANIDYTRFIRTTDADHQVAVEHLWRTLKEKGWIYKGSHEGWYAVSDEAFYPESQVEKVQGTDGQEYMQSIETGARVEWSQEENYKFRLSSFRQPLIDWIRGDVESIQPEKKRLEVLAEIESGLVDLSISRPRSRLSWGIPVPDDPSHSIYVWVDALTNYLTVTGYPDLKAGSGWPGDVHVVGKDILRFHAIYWPALLLAASLPLPKTVLAHGHWTMNKAKMSKSRGNVADPFDAIEVFGLDTLRCYLMRVGGNFGSDSDYSPSVLLEFHRKSLQGQLGNLVSRICAPKIHARLDGFSRNPAGVLDRPSKDEVAQQLDAQSLALCQKLESSLLEFPERVDALMKAFEPAKALEVIFDTVALTNELIQRLEPWSSSTDRVVVLESVVLVTESLRMSALLLSPFMPAKMLVLLDTLKVPKAERVHRKHLVVKDVDGRLVSHVLQRASDEGKPQPLFPRIELDL